jgi:hypothetical protein
MRRHILDALPVDPYLSPVPQALDVFLRSEWLRSRRSVQNGRLSIVFAGHRNPPWWCFAICSNSGATNPEIHFTNFTQVQAHWRRENTAGCPQLAVLKVTPLCERRHKTASRVLARREFSGKVTPDQAEIVVRM